MRRTIFTIYIIIMSYGISKSQGHFIGLKKDELVNEVAKDSTFVFLRQGKSNDGTLFLEYDITQFKGARIALYLRDDECVFIRSFYPNKELSLFVNTLNSSNRYDAFDKYWLSKNKRHKAYLHFYEDGPVFGLFFEKVLK